MKKNIVHNDLDISNLFFLLWDKKIIIIIIKFLFLILGYSKFHFTNKTHKALTNIKPISSFEEDKYKKFNELVKMYSFKNSKGNTYLEEKKVFFQTISKEKLLSLFINKIQNGKILEEGILKFQLLNKNNYKNETEFNEIVNKFSASIINQMISPEFNNNYSYWKFNFSVNNKKNWIDFLKYIENKANEETRLFLLDNFKKSIELYNVRKKHILEDIEQKIINANDDYEALILKKLEFLIEQAKLARVLNISNQIIELENTVIKEKNIDNFNYILNNNLYYLRGYKVIEKEIDLLNSRKNKKASTSDLTTLKEKKRSISQDKTIERIKTIFSQTPINNDSFVSAKIDYLSTSFQMQQLSFSKTIRISLLTGLIFSFIFIYLQNIIIKRK